MDAPVRFEGAYAKSLSGKSVRIDYQPPGRLLLAFTENVYRYNLASHSDVMRTALT